MRFTVTWLPDLEAELARLWDTVADRRAITYAADMIDLMLKNDPLQSLTQVDDLFFLRISPLLVLCSVNEGDRTVRVIDLRYDPSNP